MGLSNCPYEESQVSEVCMLPLNQAFTKDIKIRYLLKVRLKGSIGGKSACVIMSNPSKAKAPIGLKHSDQSVNNVIQGIHEQNLKRNNKIDKVEYIYILNLLPFYSTKQSDLIEKLNKFPNYYFEIIHRNSNFIKIISTRIDYVILAWGDQKGLLNHYLNKLKADFLEYFKGSNNIYVFYKPPNKNQKDCLFTQENNPLHPSRGKGIQDIRKVKVTHLLSLVEISSPSK